MKPLRLAIRGLGPHADTEIRLEDLASPLAVCAPYGTGKTTLLEAMLFCLYGRGGWYTDSVYDMLTQNGAGEASIALTFEEAGRLHVAQRSIKVTPATRKQTATLSRLEAAGLAPVAGPKVGDFERAVAGLVGDYETFMATCFLSQNRRGDLIGQPGEPDLVARRRQVFNDLIGASALDAIEEDLAEIQRKSVSVAEELEAQLAAEPDPAEAIQNELATCAAAERDLHAEQAALAEAESALETARRALRDAEGDDAQLKAQIERHEQSQAQESALRQRAESIGGECRELAARAQGLEKAQAESRELDALLRARKDLQDRRERHQAWKRWDDRRAELAAAVTLAETRVATLEAVPGCDAETIALATTADALLARGRALKAENEAKELLNKKRRERRADLTGALDRKRGLLGELDRRLADKPVTPMGERCAPCPLMREWAGLPSQIETLRSELAGSEKAVAAIEADEALEDLTEIRAAYERAASAGKSVAAARQASQDLAKAKSESETARNQLNEHAAGQPPKVDDPSDQLKAAQDRIDLLAGAPERVKTCELARADLARKRDELAAVEKDLAEAKRRTCALQPAADSARKALEDRRRQREALATRVDEATAQVARLRESVTALVERLARGRARLEHLDARRKQAAEKRARVAVLRDDIEGLKDLRQCFGPRGVRQILIDNAAPELEAIAADLFERATGGRMRLRIATQRVNQDDSIAEDFKILVTDERGERDALRYSGGQLQLIIILFRLAVALWVGRLHGRRPDCLVLDEAFDRLGAEGTEDMLRVLEHLADQIGMIIVVTHDPLIAQRMRSHVRLEKQFSGVLIHVAA